MFYVLLILKSKIFSLFQYLVSYNTNRFVVKFARIIIVQTFLFFFFHKSLLIFVELVMEVDVVSCALKLIHLTFKKIIIYYKGVSYNEVSLYYSQSVDRKLLKMLQNSWTIST